MLTTTVIMARIFKSFSNLISGEGSSTKLVIINQSDLEIEKIEMRLKNWKLPTKDIDCLYDKKFELKQTYKIKTVEQILPVTQDNQNFQLLD